MPAENSRSRALGTTENRPPPVFKQRIMQDWDSPFPFAGREWGLRDANLFISNTAVTLYTSLGQSVNAPHESTPLDSPIRNAYTDMHNIYQLDNNIYVHKPSELRNVSTQDIRTISKQLYGLAGEQDWEGLDLQQTALVSEKTEEKAIHLVAQKMPSSFPGVTQVLPVKMNHPRQLLTSRSTYLAKKDARGKGVSLQKP